MKSLLSMWLAFAGVALLAFGLTASADDGCGSKKSGKKGCQSCEKKCPCYGDREGADDDEDEDDDRGRRHMRRGHHDDDDDDEDEDRGRSHARRGHDDDDDDEDDDRRGWRHRGDDDDDEDDDDDDDEDDERRFLWRFQEDGGDWQEHAREMFERFGGRDGDGGRILEQLRDMMEERGGRRGGREDFGGWEDLARRGMEEFQNLPPGTRKEIEKLFEGNGEGIERMIERFRGMAEERGNRRGARKGHDEEDEEDEEEGDELEAARDNIREALESLRGGRGEMDGVRDRIREALESFQKGGRGGQDIERMMERFRDMMERRRGGHHDDEEEDEDDEEEDDDDTM